MCQNYEHFVKKLSLLNECDGIKCYRGNIDPKWEKME